MHLVKFANKDDRELKEYNPEEFGRMMGIEYLSRLKFQNDKIFQRITKHCLRASEKDYIHSKRKWLGALYAEQIREARMADVSIRWIDDTLEYGLFAERDINAWEFIGEYTGVVRRHYFFIDRINDYCFLYPTSRYFFGKYFIDGEKCGNEIRYANHSDRPNSESTGIFSDGMFHMILRAIQDIPAGRQITYDYGDRYWKNRPRIPNLR